MPNMMVTEVFKSISQGLFGSCMTRTVSLEADNERGALTLANGAIDAPHSIDSGRSTGPRGKSVYLQCLMELKREVRER